MKINLSSLPKTLFSITNMYCAYFVIVVHQKSIKRSVRKLSKPSLIAFIDWGNPLRTTVAQEFFANRDDTLTN